MVLSAVLFSALLHAAWNLMVKASPDKGLDLALVAAAGALPALVVLPVLGVPAPESWPYAVASGTIHVGYYALVGAAYRAGDMSYVYPLMRGTPPLLIALAGGPLIGEHLSAAGWAGVLVISGGILTLGLSGRGLGAATGRATAFALANAVVIAVYSFVDGTGARLSGNPVAYTQTVFLLTAIPVVGGALVRRPAAFASHAAARWRLGMTGGLCSVAAYAIALWAMTMAPIALVSALRETSIVFATALSALVLKEKFGVLRHVAAGLIMGGAVVLRLA
ncbi:DMT family transporter [Prosthecomicrobium sp. N25]|uniref:DMT family transporter n=1 Tax=Prosthecomicrobium sp. N25 TaxID=3129254 RepID=UPI00307898A9